MNHFGEHMTIDGYGGDYQLLDDPEFVKKFIDDLTETLGMKKLSETTVYFAAGNDLKDPGGWSAFVVIEESHVSIHTFPARKFLSADVYTCKNGMDRSLIEKFFKERFKLADMEVQFLLRGTKYPEANLI